MPTHSLHPTVSIIRTLFLSFVKHIAYFPHPPRGGANCFTFNQPRQIKHKHVSLQRKQNIQRLISFESVPKRLIVPILRPVPLPLPLPPYPLEEPASPPLRPSEPLSGWIKVSKLHATHTHCTS
jgi:hypothetical protein